MTAGAATCCATPDPRILEKNGRPYCHSCRRYLDRAEEPPELDVLEESLGGVETQKREEQEDHE